MYTKDKLAPDMDTAFNKTKGFFENMHFDPMGGYVDAVEAELFEGMKQ